MDLFYCRSHLTTKSFSKTSVRGGCPLLFPSPNISAAWKKSENAVCIHLIKYFHCEKRQYAWPTNIVGHAIGYRYCIRDDHHLLLLAFHFCSVFPLSFLLLGYKIPLLASMAVGRIIVYADAYFYTLFMFLFFTSISVYDFCLFLDFQLFQFPIHSYSF